MFDLQKFLASAPRTKVMGIVNATGDSFSEGGFSGPDSAVDRAERLLRDGADLLDFGGESTRPGAEEIAPAEEIARVIPAIRELHRRHPGCVISIDTRHEETARAALEAGAVILNDVSMLRRSPRLAELAARNGAALVLNHSRGEQGSVQGEGVYPAGVVQEVSAELENARQCAVAAGVAPGQILLDPGIGFSKTAEQCRQVLCGLEEIAPAGMLLVGVSRKSFLGALTGEADPQARQYATLAAELLLARRGVAVVRTHDVRALRQGLLVWQELAEEGRWKF